MPRHMDDRVIMSINPANGQTLSSWPYADAAQIESTVAAAYRASTSWRSLGAARRALFLRAVAGVLRTSKERLARTITLEMGKTHRRGRSRGGEVRLELRVRRRAWPGLACRRTGRHAGRASYVAHLPLGVVLSILPWNFPVWQIFRAPPPPWWQAIPSC